MWLTYKGYTDTSFRKNEHLPILDNTNTGLSEDIAYSLENYTEKNFASFILPVGSLLTKIGFTFVNIVRAYKHKIFLW